MKHHLFAKAFLSGLLIACLLPAKAQVQIMPLGDSITKGAVDPGPSVSGYRARLFDLLNEAHANYLLSAAPTSIATMP